MLKLESLEELKGTKGCAVRYFTFYYDDRYLVYKEAKYGVSYQLQEPSLERFKGTRYDSNYLYGLDLREYLEGDDGTFSNIESVYDRYYAIVANTVLEVTLEEVEDLYETLEDLEVDTEIVIDDLVAGIKTPLDTITIAS